MSVFLQNMIFLRRKNRIFLTKHADDFYEVHFLKVEYNNYLFPSFFLSSIFFLCLEFKKACKINVSAT